MVTNHVFNQKYKVFHSTQIELNVKYFRKLMYIISKQSEEIFTFIVNVKIPGKCGKSLHYSRQQYTVLAAVTIYRSQLPYTVQYTASSDNLHILDDYRFTLDNIYYLRSMFSRTFSWFYHISHETRYMSLHLHWNVFIFSKLLVYTRVPLEWNIMHLWFNKWFAFYANYSSSWCLLSPLNLSVEFRNTLYIYINILLLILFGVLM